MIQISENAARQIQKMLARNQMTDGALRVAIKAGGCSGFEYVFGWADAPRDDDQVFEGPDGAKLFVDTRSLRLLDGTLLDYDTSLISKGFVFNNPNAKTTCGCGSSFGA